MTDVTVNVYNGAGQVIKTTDPNGNVTTYSYDAMNRLIGETTAAGTSLAGISTYTYDKAGNQVTATDPNNDTTTTTYDAMDRQSTVKDPDGGVTTDTYNSDGELYVLTDPVGNRTTFLYDSLGRQTTQISPSVNSSTGVTSTTEYDADGEVVETTDADGRVITYSYDSRGDQTGESWLNSAGAATYIATYTYNADREMTAASDPNSLITIAYDRDGRVGTMATSATTTGTGQPAVTLTYSYDPSGDVTTIKDSLSTDAGITTFAYDNALRLTTITQSFGGTAGPQVVYNDDPDGLVYEQQRSIGDSGSALVTTYQYDADDDVTAIDTGSGTVGGIQPDNISIGQDIGDGYNAAGQVTSMVLDNAGTETSTTYSYDPSGQVTGSTGGSDDTYSYDLDGNPNSTGYEAGAGNELTNSPGVTYTYDNDGNIITAKTFSGTTTYTYDYENRLTSVDQDGVMVATYTYNSLGQRIAIDDGGTRTWTVYNGTDADADPYADFTASGSVSVHYLFGPAAQPDTILATTSAGGTTQWSITDSLGSVDYVESTSGTVLDAITYDAFGDIVSQSDSSYAGRFMFAGMQYDAETGLYYDHARYYDAAIGRFTSRDPKGFAAGDTNLYRYVTNDPTIATDPSGMQGPGPQQGPGGFIGIEQPLAGFVAVGRPTVGFGLGYTWAGGGRGNLPGGSVSTFWVYTPGSGWSLMASNLLTPGSPDPSPTLPLSTQPSSNVADPYTGRWPPYDNYPFYPDGSPIYPTQPSYPPVPFPKRPGHTFGPNPWWGFPFRAAKRLIK